MTVGVSASVHTSRQELPDRPLPTKPAGFRGVDEGRACVPRSSSGHFHGALALDRLLITKRRAWSMAPPHWVADTHWLRMVYPSAPLEFGPPSLV